jgi:hypothetical protein
MFLLYTDDKQVQFLGFIAGLCLFYSFQQVTSKLNFVGSIAGLCLFYPFQQVTGKLNFNAAPK